MSMTRFMLILITMTAGMCANPELQQLVLTYAPVAGSRVKTRESIA